MLAQNKVGQHRNRVGVVTLRDIWREADGIRIIIMLTVHRALSKVSCCNRCNMLMAVSRDAGGEYGVDATKGTQYGHLTVWSRRRAP